MIIKAIKIIVLNIVFLCSIQLASSQENIIPKKKPDLSVALIKKKISKNILIPVKKPILDQKKEEEKKYKIKGIIQSKNKPLIVRKGREKISKKSKYYSDRDFNYAKQAIKFMEKSNWKDAIKVAKKARAKSIYDFIQWQHLLTTGNRASFYDYKEFIERNKNYPRIGRIKYLAEHKLYTKDLSPKKIVEWFENKEPLSGFGKIVLGKSLIHLGNRSEGIRLIKEGWINADLSKSDLKFFRKKFKKYLSRDDYIKRADYLAWENKYWDLKRMLRYLPKDYQLLYTARQRLMSKSYGVDSAINKVPKKLKNDSGLNYDRLKWRRKRGRVDSSLEILLNIKKVTAKDGFTIENEIKNVNGEVELVVTRWT